MKDFLRDLVSNYGLQITEDPSHGTRVAVRGISVNGVTGNGKPELLPNSLDSVISAISALQPVDSATHTPNVDIDGYTLQYQSVTYNNAW